MSDSLADHEFSMTHNGAQYEIAVYNVRSDADGRLMYDVLVRNANGVVVVSDDFVIVNPPIMVPDGTYRTEIQDGEEVQIANMVEDLVGAFEQFTKDAVSLLL